MTSLNKNKTVTPENEKNSKKLDGSNVNADIQRKAAEQGAKITDQKETSNKGSSDHQALDFKDRSLDKNVQETALLRNKARV
jgi:hypothetical protein